MVGEPSAALDRHVRPEQGEGVMEAMSFGGKCRVPMWMGGCPAGFCDKEAYGEQLPREVLSHQRGWDRPPYCHGPCCPSHGGPNQGEPIVLQDGYSERGRRMFCAVMPGFRNLQEDVAGFDEDGNRAIAKLRAALADQNKGSGNG